MKILVDHGSSYNLGDIAMLEGTVIKLRSLLPRADFFIFDNPVNLKTNLWELPNVYKQQAIKLDTNLDKLLINMPFFWRYNSYWRNYIYSIYLSLFENFFYTQKKRFSKFSEPFDALFIAGGGNLCDSFPKLLLMKSCLIEAFKQQKKPVLLTGQQLGPFKNYFIKKSFINILRKIDFIGLRENTYSFTLCNNAGISQNHFGVMGDDSLGLSSAEEYLINNILKENGIKPSEFLAVNIRVAKYSTKVSSHIQKVAFLIRKLAEKLKMPVLFVPIAFNDWDNDIAAAKRLTNFIKYPPLKILNYKNIRPELTQGILGKAFGAIGVSYHFCTFALSQGVPAVCIYDGGYYVQKAIGLCSFWQDERLAVSLKIKDADLFAKGILDLFEDGLVREKLKKRAKSALTNWNNIFEKITKQYLRQIP